MNPAPAISIFSIRFFNSPPDISEFMALTISWAICRGGRFRKEANFKAQGLEISPKDFSLGSSNRQDWTCFNASPETLKTPRRTFSKRSASRLWSFS